MRWIAYYILPVFLPTVIVGLVLTCGCKSIQVNRPSDRIIPRNDRDWIAEMQLLTTAEFSVDSVIVRNIRNSEYLSDGTYVLDYYDRTIKLDDVQTVDFVVVPFNNMPAIAHTMLSFGLADGTYLTLSVEIRKEKGEDYSPVLGISNQFEIMYVLADERDLIRVRTRHRSAEVYVYPTVATKGQARQMFIDCLQRANELAARPEFYNTFTNNCTTNLVSHVNKLSSKKVPFGWKVLLPGYSAEYAYELGLLSNELPFDELKQLAYVNDLAEEYYDLPNFSQLIRQRHRQIKRAAELNEARAVRSNNGSAKR